MRSPKEIAHRLRQELTNLLLWVRPPRGGADFAPPSPLPQLPDPSRAADLVRGSSFPDQIRGHAREILSHRFPLLGLTVDTGPEIRWRRDYVNRRETGRRYFRLIPYLDATRAGDHKIIWELNRHQHLVLLAQMHLLDGDPAWLEEIWRQLESWLEDNPFQRGINWSSALEVALRAWSWIWIYHLAGVQMPRRLRDRFLDALYLHGCHVEANLSYYFSPNTHLLGEAVVLHALGVLFPKFPRARKWSELGAKIVEEQLARQVREDGGHFEQSTYYHVYALDMLLVHGILANAGEAHRAKIARMADYLAAVQGPSRILPFIGDDDGGRFFHPFGPRPHFGRATLATCAVWLDRSDWSYTREDLFPQAVWWLGRGAAGSTAALSSRLFRDSGMAVMIAGDAHILIDAGPFGPWGSGHSHSDTLHIVARSGEREILIDPGTYTYVGDAAARDWFRGSAAHNTVRLDALDQAVPVNPFRWTGQPEVSITSWASSRDEDFLDAQCSYRDIVHRRRVRFIKPDLLLIVDQITGERGSRTAEQFWHLAAEEDRTRFTLLHPAELVQDWRSPVFGCRLKGHALRSAAGNIPAVLATVLQLGAKISPAEIRLSEMAVVFEVGGRHFEIALEFSRR